MRPNMNREGDVHSRRELRLPIECPITYWGPHNQGEGFVTNLSMGGWHVESSLPMPPGTILVLSVCLPDVLEPVEVQLAQVQWSSGRKFGLRNIVMSQDNRTRLQRFLDENYEFRGGAHSEFVKTTKPWEDQGRLRSAHRGASEGSSPAAPQTGTPLLGALGPSDKEDMAFKLQDTASVLQITFGDLLTFMNYIHDATKAFDTGQPFPSAPKLQAERLQSCVDLIEKLEHRCRQSRAIDLLLESSLHGQESELGRLLSRLHDNVATLYENLGQQQKAGEIRKQAAAIQSS